MYEDDDEDKYEIPSFLVCYVSKKEEKTSLKLILA